MSLSITLGNYMKGVNFDWNYRIVVLTKAESNAQE